MKAAPLVDRLKMAIAPGGYGRGGFARHRVPVRRHDHPSPRMALVRPGADTISITGLVTRERGHGVGDLVERRPDRRGVAATIRPPAASMPMSGTRHDRRLPAPCCSSDHSPGPLSFEPVLSTSGCSGPPLARGRAGRWGIEPSSPWSDATPRRRRATSALLGKPHREAAASAQGSTMRRPVGQAPFRPRSMMTTAGIGLVRHGERSRAVGGARLAVLPVYDLLTCPGNPSQAGCHFRRPKHGMITTNDKCHHRDFFNFQFTIPC